MKPFEIPLFSLEPWDDLDDIISASTDDPSGSAGDYTTPQDEFGS